MFLVKKTKQNKNNPHTKTNKQQKSPKILLLAFLWASYSNSILSYIPFPNYLYFNYSAILLKLFFFASLSEERNLPILQGTLIMPLWYENLPNLFTEIHNFALYELYLCSYVLKYHYWYILTWISSRISLRMGPVPGTSFYHPKDKKGLSSHINSEHIFVGSLLE